MNDAMKSSAYEAGAADLWFIHVIHEVFDEELANDFYSSAEFFSSKLNQPILDLQIRSSMGSGQMDTWNFV